MSTLSRWSTPSFVSIREYRVLELLSPPKQNEKKQKVLGGKLTAEMEIKRREEEEEEEEVEADE
ncbi:hypothetical protein RUM44_006637 [Polyplax serrata]|uniref:Uncharacterized protein n=1 Tax=Polyplax serrata TaxID=468196 RepID=A0ABR1AIN5_POLSC